MSTATDFGHRPSFRQVPIAWPDRSTPRLLDDPPPADGIEARFDAVHAAHPEVAVELIRRTRLALAAKQKPTMKKLWEDLRAEGWSLTDGSPFKLDNCYTALYARLVMEQAPDLAGTFRLRPRRSR